MTGWVRVELLGGALDGATVTVPADANGRPVAELALLAGHPDCPAGVWLTYRLAPRAGCRAGWAMAWARPAGGGTKQVNP